MGSKWAGEEQARDWEAVAHDNAASPDGKSEVIVALSAWPNHKIPVGLSMTSREMDRNDDPYIYAHVYMEPDQAEALGTALIYYARKLRGEI